MDKKCMYCIHISRYFDSCELPWECKYEPNFIAKRFIEELEKIKDEILEHNRRYISDDNAGLERAIQEFIEPHIEELKGEEKTGKWVWDWSISCECPKYVCSVCGNTAWIKTDRCPKCKAIMKGDNK